MAQKDVGNKIPIYKLKKTDEVMKYYEDWGQENKYDKDMLDWNYTGPKETTETFIKYQKNKHAKIYDAGCGTGLVGVELKKFGYHNFYGADLSKKLLDLVPSQLYKKLDQVDLNKPIDEENGITLVEFSSPNTNKPLHLGHIRNNLLGDSITRILKANGYKTIKTQIINDRGIHICKMHLILYLSFFLI